MKKSILAALSLLGFLLVGCVSEKNSSLVSNPASNSESGSIDGNSSSSSNGSYFYEGTPMKASFTAYNQDGSSLGVYDNPFYAIAEASNKGLSTNKTYVTDANGLKIFERTKRTNYYCFDGANYVGNKESAVALEWGAKKSRCYMINGLGNGFAYLGRDDMKGTSTVEESSLELVSGAYNYLFSNSGVYDDANPIPGYAYGRTIVRLSDAHYLPSKDGNGWNAYIFLNVKGMSVSNDMGLIGNFDQSDNTIHWRPCKNCTYSAGHSGDSFMTYPADLMTRSVWNETSKDYTGADDIEIEAWADDDGFEFNLTNLATKKTFHHREEHVGVNSASKSYYRVLLAASYCPVVAPVWNGDCGAYFKNVVFDHVQIAKYQEDGLYSSASLFDFYPGEETTAYGYSQGGNWATHDSGIRKENGSYSSGNAYAAGDKFVTFSVAYDGSAHQA